MNLLTRQFFSRLLILIMTISPVQMTMAIDLDQHNQAVNCQVSQAQLPDTTISNTSGGCTSEYGEHCVDLSVCGAQFNFSSLYSSKSFLLITRAVTHTKFTADNDAVSSRYPELLKRPPKV
jgi:hypothetical protein